MNHLSKAEKELLKKLKDAYAVCRDCGMKYGVFSAGESSIWMDDCDVCGEKKAVTESRDYAYLITGIRKLTMGSGQITDLGVPNPR